MFQVTGLKKSYGQRVLFENVTFTVANGQRVGLVGRNGSGKSTLLKIIMNLESGDSGELSTSKGYRKGYLKQHIQFDETTVRDEVASELPEEQKYDTWRAEKILHGLGFTDEMMGDSPASFSGGYQVRINLAKTLVGSPGLLILDEPTNYLDIVSLRWLRRFLVSYPGEVLLVTHDRELMDSVVTHVMGIHRGQLRKFAGKTGDYYEQLLIDEEMYEKTRINQEKQRKQIEQFVNKFRAKARQASLAQSRMKMLEKMDVKDKLANQKNLEFQFPYEECPSKTVLNVEALSFGYEEGPKLIQNLKFALGRNECLAIIGKNGKGKSTLMNLVTGDLKADSGKIEFHNKGEIGHFGQTNINRLNDENTVEQEISYLSKDISSQQARSIAGTVMFDGDDSQKQIKILSGGEKSRVMMGKILATKTNILLLDEPTNHLDQESVEGLLEGLQYYPGAIIIITHSEYILRQLATKLLVFHRGNVEFFDGGYDDFLNRIGWEEENEVEEVLVKNKLSKKEMTRLRQNLIQEKSRETKDLRKSIDQLEDQIDSFEKRQKAVEILLIKAAEESNGDQITSLSKESSELNDMIELKFEELSDSSEKLDQIELLYQQKLSDLES